MDLFWLVEGLRLARPEALWLLAALPPWLLAVRLAGRRAGGLTFPHAELGQLPRSWRVRLLGLPTALRALTLVLLILALARPQLGRTREKVTQQGIDIILALDVSASMLAEDVGPNRLEAAKRTIQRFVARLTTDRVGLVVFAGRSFTQCPLTTDYGAVLELVDECRIDMVGFPGTALGEALANCVYRFENEARRPAGDDPQTAKTLAEQAKQRSRVVILLTDGYNNTGRIEPAQAAEMARVKNIKVHCVGVGRPEGAPVPYYQDGRRRYMVTPGGQLQIAILDEATLKGIAAQTGGVYFRATSAEALDQIYQQIARMEKNKIEVKQLTHQEERFLPLVMLALLTLAAELVLRATTWRVTA